MVERQVLVVGAGGIGSWLIQELFLLFDRNQVLDCFFSVADDDTIDIRNLLAQNFSEDDLFDYKVEVLATKFPILLPIKEKIITEEQLQKYECILCCVDSTEFRKLLFTVWNKNRNFYFIDLRAEGRNIGFLTANKKWSLEKLLETLPKEESKRGCQREEDLQKGVVELGNKIIASIGSQLFLNWHRNKTNIIEFSMRV